MKAGETMIHKREVFIKILLLELEDLEEDINLLIKECEDRHCKSEISEYVFLENLAILKNEMFGVESFANDVKNIDALSFKNVDELLEALKEIIGNRIREKGLAKSVQILVERKMNKVAQYVKSKDGL